MQGFYVEDKDGVSVLKLSGRFDATSSPEIHEKIMGEIERGSSKIVLDFTEVDYISSAGLRVVIYAGKSLQKNSGKFALCCPNNNILKIFEISGLSELFTIHEDLDSSVAFCNE